MSILVTDLPNDPSAVENACLACCGGIPPGARPAHITACCSRPICSVCIRGNPRLARYMPCLSCLSGPGALAASSGFTRDKRGSSKQPICQASQSPSSMKAVHQPSTRGIPVESGKSINLDGSLRDEDVFIVGDEDGDEDEDEANIAPELPLRDCDPPSCRPPASPAADSTDANSNTPPSSHKIRKEDTLRGLARMYGVDVRLLVRPIGYVMLPVSFNNKRR